MGPYQMDIFSGLSSISKSKLCFVISHPFLTRGRFILSSSTSIFQWHPKYCQRSLGFDFNLICTSTWPKGRHVPGSQKILHLLCFTSNRDCPSAGLSAPNVRLLTHPPHSNLLAKDLWDLPFNLSTIDELSMPFGLTRSTCLISTRPDAK